MPQLRVELDAVEDLNTLRRKANMLAVKVAMHIANPAFVHSTRKQVVVGVDEIRAEFLHRRNRVLLDQGSKKRLEIGEIFLPLFFYGRRVREGSGQSGSAPLGYGIGARISATARIISWVTWPESIRNGNIRRSGSRRIISVYSCGGAHPPSRQFPPSRLMGITAK